MANPNCQQIPVRTVLGREIRRQFVADEGNKLVAIDYSQIELRVAAHLSRCKSMVEAFREGRDIHTETAMRLFGTPEPSSYMRYAAKTLNFGVIYGITAEGFQAQMQVEGQDWTVEDCRGSSKRTIPSDRSCGTGRKRRRLSLSGMVMWQICSGGGDISRRYCVR